MEGMKAHLLAATASSAWWERLALADADSNGEPPLRRALRGESVLLRLALLRKAYPYLFERLHREPLRTASVAPDAAFFDAGAMGRLSERLGADELAHVLSFCDESTLACSVAPACFALRHFLCTPAFFREIAGAEFTTALDVLFKAGESAQPYLSATLDAFGERTKEAALVTKLNDLRTLVQDARQGTTWPVLFDALDGEIVALQLQCLSYAFEARQELVRATSGLQDLVAECEWLAEPGAQEGIRRLLAQAAFLGSAVNDTTLDRFSGTAWVAALPALELIRSRFDNNYTAVHHVVLLLRDGWAVATGDASHSSAEPTGEAVAPSAPDDSALFDSLLQLDWALRVLSNRFEFEAVRDSRPCSPIADASDAVHRFHGMQQAVKQLRHEMGQRAFATDLEPVLGVLEPIARDLEALVDRAQTAHRTALDGILDSDPAPWNRQQHLLALSMFVSKCIRVCEDASGGQAVGIEQLLAHAEAVMAKEQLALDEQRAIVAQTAKQRPGQLALEEVRSGNCTAVRTKLEQRLSARDEIGKREARERVANVRSELDSLDLNIDARAAALSASLCTRFPHPDVVSAAATAETDADELPGAGSGGEHAAEGEPVSAVANSSEGDSPVEQSDAPQVRVEEQAGGSSADAGGTQALPAAVAEASDGNAAGKEPAPCPKEPPSRTAQWKAPRAPRGCQKWPIGPQDDRKVSTFAHERYLGWIGDETTAKDRIKAIFSTGPNVFLTQAVQQGRRFSHFTSADFTGESGALSKSRGRHSSRASGKSRSGRVLGIAPDGLLRKSSADGSSLGDPAERGEQSAAEASPPCEPSALELPLEQLRELVAREETDKYGLARAALEQHLRADEFARVFGMGKPEFAGLALWRQKALKKQHGLF